MHVVEYNLEITVTKPHINVYLVDMVSADFANRPIKKLVLFDVDGTLTLARKAAEPEMIQMLRDLRKKVAIGFVGGSDMEKIKEQLEVHGMDVLKDFDFAFAENGLTAYRLGEQLESQSFIKYLGEDNYKKLVNFILIKIAEIDDIPIKRGTFIEFRNGMINVSPVGRNCSHPERKQFEDHDKVKGIRKGLIDALQQHPDFAAFNLTYSIGGKISFDVFPTGWDKTYALRHVENEGFEEIHFFGDKTDEGGNDHEIYEKIEAMHRESIKKDPALAGKSPAHKVAKPDDTIRICRELFLET